MRRNDMAVIYGTEGPDKKNGTAANDTMHGWAKGGKANSLSGDDTLNNNAGNDNLKGGAIRSVETPQGRITGFTG